MIKRGKRKGWKAKYHLALLHTVITRGPKRLSETRGRGKQEAAQKGLMCNPVGHQAPAASLSWSLGSICHPQATYQLSPPTSTFKTSQGRPGPATRYPPPPPLALAGPHGSVPQPPAGLQLRGGFTALILIFSEERVLKASGLHPLLSHRGSHLQKPSPVLAMVPSVMEGRAQPLPLCVSSTFPLLSAVATLFCSWLGRHAHTVLPHSPVARLFKPLPCDMSGLSHTASSPLTFAFWTSPIYGTPSHHAPGAQRLHGC